MHRNLQFGVAFGLMGSLFVAAQVGALDFGDARRGSALAMRVCVACHGVRERESSTNPLAPPFEEIAEIRGMSEMAVNVALLSPHRAMPNIVLDPQERADVAAYIMTLKSK